MSQYSHHKLPLGPDKTTGNAIPYLVMAMVCAVFIVSANLKSLIIDGWAIRQIAPHIIVMALIVTVVIQFLLNKPKSLTNLGIIGKLYLILVVILHAIGSTAIGQNWVNAGELIYIVAVLYLAMIDAVPALRQRASLAPVGVKGTMIRVASFTLPLALLVSTYLVWALTAVPGEVRNLRTVPFQEMLDNHGTVSSEGFRWEDQLNSYLKKDMSLKAKLGDGTIIWRNDDGETLIYRKGTVGEGYARFGYSSPYDFERVIWNAGIVQYVPLIMKNMIVRPNITTKAYHIETDQLKAIVVIMEQNSGTGFAEFRMHPKEGTSYTMTYSGKTLADTVKLVVLTVEKLMAE